jgi:hypothetical protein
MSKFSSIRNRPGNWSVTQWQPIELWVLGWNLNLFDFYLVSAITLPLPEVDGSSGPAGRRKQGTGRSGQNKTLQGGDHESAISTGQQKKSSVNSMATSLLNDDICIGNFFNRLWKLAISRNFIRRELAQFIRETGPENQTTLVDRPHNKGSRRPRTTPDRRPYN